MSPSNRASTERASILKQGCRVVRWNTSQWGHTTRPSGLSWALMVKLQRRPFGEPDNVREVPLGHLETYDMGEIRIGRSILQPGWRWSESIKPITRTELCEYHHIGVCLSGRMRVQTREGAELTIDAGQFYEIPAGHEAWVEGDEPYVNIEWQPSVAFGEAEGGDFDRIVATLLVTDIVNSTARALELGDGAWRDLLAQHDRAVRNQ